MSARLMASEVMASVTTSGPNCQREGHHAIESKMSRITGIMQKIPGI